MGRAIRSRPRAARLGHAKGLLQRVVCESGGIRPVCGAGWSIRRRPSCESARRKPLRVDGWIGSHPLSVVRQ